MRRFRILRSGVFSILMYCISICSGCHSIPDGVLSVISKSDNGTELLKVIEHFQKDKDPKKLEAVYYLLEQMNYKRHVTGDGVDNFNALFTTLYETPSDSLEWLVPIFDSLVARKNIRFPGKYHFVRDYETITSKELIDHINASFMSWGYPWARALNFRQFCQYILPYKLVEEKPTAWNQHIQRYYQSFTENLNTKDPYEVCVAINQQLKKEFKIRSVPANWELDFFQLDGIRSGKCYHATQYTTYVMRALGLPVVMDYTPYWGNMNGGHNWNALIYKGKPIPFVGSESDIGKTKIDLAFQRKRSKVYRFAYEIQKDGLQYIAQGTEEIPSLFKNYYLKDVTKDYVPVSDVEVSLNNEEIKRGYVYLCVFNRQSWQAVAWAENKDGKAIFKDMGREVVYLPAYYEAGKYIGAGPPFVLHADGSIEKLDPRKKSIQVVVKKKSPRGPAVIKGNEYELLFWENGWQSLGKQKANMDSLTFSKVPLNSLIWARSKDKSSHERIFLYKNGQQVWW